MGKKKVYYIDNKDNNLEIKQGYTGNINLNKVNEIVIEYKHNKIKLSNELVAETEEALEQQLNRLKIIKLAESYGLTNVRWIGHSLYFNNILDRFYVYENVCNKLVWMHCNELSSKYNNHEHLQKITYSNNFGDWDYIFRTCSQHDSYEFNRNIKNRKLHLFDMIKKNEVPKIKIC